MPEKKKKEPEVFHVRVKMEGELARRFDIVKNHHGFESNTDLARMLFNKEYERIQTIHRGRVLAVSRNVLVLGLEYFNTYEDHATIRDHKLGLYVDVYPRPEGKLWCSHCKKTNCEHTRFALTVPEIMEPLKKRGWAGGK